MCGSCVRVLCASLVRRLVRQKQIILQNTVDVECFCFCFPRVQQPMLNYNLCCALFCYGPHVIAYPKSRIEKVAKRWETMPATLLLP